ncbi:hypothetical protein AAVH_14097 [Aphelenchoides avenae]|nr:hypothetical protein AAVH_14097 [Aphelenchus avenae]
MIDRALHASPNLALSMWTVPQPWSGLHVHLPTKIEARQLHTFISSKETVIRELEHHLQVLPEGARMTLRVSHLQSILAGTFYLKLYADIDPTATTDIESLNSNICGLLDASFDEQRLFNARQNLFCGRFYLPW